MTLLYPNLSYDEEFVCLVWFLTSQSTVMVMSGRSVHLTTPFPGQA